MDKININAVDATQSREGAVEALLGVDINGEVRRTNITKLDTYSKSEIDSKDDAIKQYTDLQISALIGGATPENLDTIAKLASALQDDDNAINAINNELSTKYGPDNKPTPAAIGAQPAGSYAASSHTHPWAQITGVPAQATRWPTPAEVGAQPAGSYAAASHTHTELGGSNYTSGGSELPNYFGGGKLTYRMLGQGGTKGGIAGSTYSDAIWVSSYAGGDVNRSNVLLFSKDGAPRVGFRQQDYDATTWGTFNEIYHSGRKPTPAEIGAQPAGSYAAASHSHHWTQISGVPVQATRWPTPAEVGALPLSGGNINGPLTASSVIRSGSQVRGFGTGNTYVSAGLETGATTSDPSISFHREGHYAATLRLINPDSFGFLNQANSAYCDLTVKALAATSNISVGGGISIKQVEGLGKGLSLYGSPMMDPDYGVMFAQIPNFGGHGAVGGDWATYFNMIGAGNRGWIFRYKGVKNAASISCNGDIHASSVTVNNIATGDLSISRNVGATGDVYAKSFYGNANIAGTGTAVNCPSGIYSQGTNWLYGPIITSNNSIDAGSGAVTCGNVTANGVIRGHAFIGEGFNLSRLDWNKLINKPNVANDWINIFNGGIGGRVNKVNIPPQMLNHLKAGRMVEVRAFLNHQGRAGSNRRTMTSIIDGADGWVSYVNDKVSHDMTWYGISSFYVLNASSQHGGDANSFKSQHQNITRIDMRLL